MPSVTVYRLYAEDRSLLYVGRSEDLPQRLYEHSLRQPWWDEVASHSTEVCADIREAEEREREVIRTEAPRYNVLMYPRPKPASPRAPQRPRAGWKTLCVDVPAELRQSVRLCAVEEGTTVGEIVRTALVAELGRRARGRGGHR